MKKLVVFIVLVIMALCLSTVLVACYMQTECAHLNGWETIDEHDSTCTTPGYKIQVCLDCSLENLVEIPVKTHEYAEAESTAATCEKDGTRIFRCVHCGDERRESIPCTGHKEVIDEAVAPTCTKGGSTEGSHCETCGVSLTDMSYIMPTGHIGRQKGMVESTCSVEGHTDYECQVCGEAWSEPIAKASHKLDDGVIFNKAVCDAQGTIIYTCLVCSKNEYEAIPATGHTDGMIVVSKNPSCIAPGSQSVHCKDCSTIIRTEAIAPLGHLERKNVV